MKFSGYIGYDTRNNLEIWGTIGLTHRIQESFFYFVGLYLLATSRNNGWMDIDEIFRIWTQGAIGCTVSRMNRLFHAFHTRREVCALGVLLVVIIIVLSKIYSDINELIKWQFCPNLHDHNSRYNRGSHKAVIIISSTQVSDSHLSPPGALQSRRASLQWT